MSSTTLAKTAIPAGLDARVLVRTLEEGYGPGAWHGADLKDALADVAPALAFWRPSPERHNIAEVALHHAYCVRVVRGRISGHAPEPFVMEGEDWFALPDASHFTWPQIRDLVAAEQQRLVEAVGAPAAARGPEAVGEADRFDLVLGITCHAVYHAGQIQLLKKLAPSVVAS